MAGEVTILGADGNPVPKPRANALAGGGSHVPYDAADSWGAHMAAWQPYLGSADTDLVFRDRIVSRVRDLVRNDGWAAGGVTRILDNVIGAVFRPIAKPDYRALAAWSGNTEFDAKWADRFGRAVEANWRTWANDPARYCDVSRALTVPQLLRLAFRHKLIDGDALAILQWLPARISPGRARYATAVQIVDPDRLSNPQNQWDQRYMRGGVQIDDFGAAEGYWIRRAHQGDWYNAVASVTWDYIGRETAWGRPVVVHDFDHDRGGQHRGGAGVFTPILQRLKMLVKYDGTELDAAIINAIFGAYIESPFDSTFVEEALGAGEDMEPLNNYQQQRADFHCERRIMLGDARIPILFPGEKVNTVAAERPSTNFRDFESAVLRNCAAALGISPQQLGQDWSDVNYSSARAALLEAWKTLMRRRQEFASGFASLVYAAFLEESMAVDDLPLPDDAPDFIDCRAAYCRCEWIGPPRGWIDPVAEKQGAVLGMDAGLSTLEAECAEQGLDYEEVLDQRAREIEAFKERGIPVPTWAGMQPGFTPSGMLQPANAQQVTKKPDAT
jgi:lambda family phage portal protein